MIHHLDFGLFSSFGTFVTFDFGFLVVICFFGLREIACEGFFQNCILLVHHRLVVRAGNPKLSIAF